MNLFSIVVSAAIGVVDVALVGVLWWVAGDLIRARRKHPVVPQRR